MLRLRSKHVIAADILKLTKEPKLKTHVMYSANLSFSQSQYYFNILASAGLIQNVDDNMWVTTEKGRKFVQLFEEAEMLLKQELPSLRSMGRL